MKPGIKKWMGRVLLLLLGLVVAVVFLEILSRVFWSRLSELENVRSISFISRKDYKKLNPPDFFWPGHMGNVREFSVLTTLNKLKFHDTEHSFLKPEGTFRIIVLGDSFVEANQVPLQKTFEKILETELNEKMRFSVEVISLGRSGTGTAKSDEILREIGLRYQPDLVIMEFLSNDLIDNSPNMLKEEKEQIKRREKYVPDLESAYRRFLWIKPSRFNQIIALKLARLYQSFQVAKHFSQDKYGFIHLNTLVFSDQYSGLWEKPWRRTEKLILQARELSEKNNAKFLMVSFPEMWRVGSLKEMKRRIKAMSRQALDYRWDFDKTDRVLREFCREKEIDFLSLLPVFRQAYAKTKKRLHYAFDMHLNERGHRIAAEAILEYLLRKDLVSN
jgi:hypothetical protein